MEEKYYGIKAQIENSDKPYPTLDAEKLREFMLDIKKEKEIVIVTGVGGMIEVDANLTCDFYKHTGELDVKFIELYKERYYTNQKLNKYESNFFVKVLKFLRLIKV
jgi:hypothetical protein